MMNNTVWSQEFGAYVSRSFLPEKEREPAAKKSVIKFDITKCIIKITCFGFYELWLNDNKLKYIGFMEYLKFKKYVKEIIKEEYYE